jgi:hypothetical protein
VSPGCSKKPIESKPADTFTNDECEDQSPSTFDENLVSLSDFAFSLELDSEGIFFAHVIRSL